MCEFAFRFSDILCFYNQEDYDDGRMYKTLLKVMDIPEKYIYKIGFRYFIDHYYNSA